MPSLDGAISIWEAVHRNLAQCWSMLVLPWGRQNEGGNSLLLDIERGSLQAISDHVRFLAE